MEERRRELMFEGKRWFDVVRRCHREGNASYAKVIPGKNGGATPASYEGLFWPYNKNELKNNPLLKQKEYYGGSDTDGNYSSTK
ncbi:MAG: RagB/SusD family nutrient uptake outer membrane protein, partial [Bacteroidaceae bacterium]|nr:RagB/SusD family nutrient uptake outer membrane protein [Bacteroidaceae bacterium]